MTNRFPKFLCLVILLLVGGASPLAAAGLGATPASAFHVPEGFEVEMLYEVPQSSEGSWVSLTVDPQGRLLTCDQYGGLFRITLATGDQPLKVERVQADIGMAQGLLFAFDSLYVNVNGSREPGNSGGVFRLRDQDGDDAYETVEHILPLNNGGEHGPHALLLSPDGKQIYLCAGNNTFLPKPLPHSRVPQHWDEDHLLDRMPDARGHNADRLAPGGFVAKMDPDGKNFEVIATGFRNEYDMAFNPDGELFAYDADMEWDVGTPWYRPTRVNHVVSGGEFGWRNGTGKWPAYYVDSVGAAVDIGPGSPTGVCFGTGAKFPAKYQRALYVLDWSYGNIYAVHLNADGSTYSGDYEIFATAAPLPVTDIVIHPEDGNMYFTIGGRRTQSALYRVRYVGSESTVPAEPIADPEAQQLRSVRHELEALHFDPKAAEENVDTALAHLSHPDRQIRYAARIALEHQPVGSWRDRVASLKDPNAKLTAVVALARCGEAQDLETAIEVLQTIDFADASPTQQLDLLRAYGLTFIRLGQPSDAHRQAIVESLNEQFPQSDPRVNRELAMVLTYLRAPHIVTRVVDQLVNAPSQEDQIHYAFVLRNVETGWSEADRERYFGWFRDVASSRGGMSFGGFLENIRQAAISHLSDSEKASLAEVLERPAPRDPLADLAPRVVVQDWKVADLAEAVSQQDHPADFERGKQMFAVAQCYKCHRIGTQGGILGPDLTGAGGRFSSKDLLTAIIDPNQSISDQYAATQFLTDSGEVVVGKIVNMNGNNIQVLTNMLDPSQLKSVNRDHVESAQLSRTSMMPAGLLDTLNEEEIQDLMVYLRAGGNPHHALYDKP